MSDKIYAVPTNMNECFAVLDEIFKESKEDFDWLHSSEEQNAMSNLHHSLGRWIRNTWGLWTKDTQIYETLKNMGLWHADDMSSIILTSYHRKIHGKELNLKEQIQHFLDYWNEYEKTNGPVEK